ncbi:MAG: 4Fe-4S dicluster domain-containing protein [Chloroflexi bacterium]|nr:4Fe-4S dicluster domain-containing protein [Chloroflexota bacterium]
MPKGRVVINEEACKGCALCVSACKQDVLALAESQINARGYHPIEYVDPRERCTGCGLCAVICPDAVITVYRQRRTPARANTVVTLS